MLKHFRSQTSVIVLAAALAAIAASASPAQVLYGSIVGNVSDPSGAPVPGASVTIREKQTGQTRTGVSTETGAFTFPTVAARTL